MNTATPNPDAPIWQLAITATAPSGEAWSILIPDGHAHQTIIPNYSPWTWIATQVEHLTWYASLNEPDDWTPAALTWEVTLQRL